MREENKERRQRSRTMHREWKPASSYIEGAVIAVLFALVWVNVLRFF